MMNNPMYINFFYVLAPFLFIVLTLIFNKCFRKKSTLFGRQHFTIGGLGFISIFASILIFEIVLLFLAVLDAASFISGLNYFVERNCQFLLLVFYLALMFLGVKRSIDTPNGFMVFKLNKTATKPKGEKL